MTSLQTRLETLLAGSPPVHAGSGCAAAVVRDGEVLAHAWAGTARAGTPWDDRTLVHAWSAAKPFAALTVLLAVADGHLALDEPVVTWWPAYAAPGTAKATTTVRHLLAHQAGLPRFPAAADDVDPLDRPALVALLEGAEPEHGPGAAHGEHALTYGHLLDELHRRAVGPSLADAFARFADRAGWDLHLAVAADDLDRCADVVGLAADWPTAYLTDPRWGDVLARPPGLLDPAVVNGRAYRTASFPAVSLHATALGLATAYDDLRRPDGRAAAALGPELHRAFLAPATSGPDLVLGRDVAWALGPQVDLEGGDPVEVGMGGVGGSGGWASYRSRFGGTGHGCGFVTGALAGPGDPDVGDDVWELVEEERDSRPFSAEPA